MNTVLRINNLVKQYASSVVKAVDDISFEVYQGNVLDGVLTVEENILSRAAFYGTGSEKC